MALSDNLAAAEATIEYVKGLKILAINKRSDRIAAAGGIDKVVGTSQGQSAMGKLPDTATVAQFQTAAGPLTTSFVTARYGGFKGASIRDDVVRYIKAKAGNCAEQAEIALIYLFDNYPAIRPLSLMSFTTKGYDHAWLVIDLAADYDKASPLGGQNLRNWGADAVWCDPWQSGGVAFGIQDLVKGGVRNLNSIYKCNTAESVAAGNPRETDRYGP